MNLLKDLKSELGLTYLFVSHNLAVIDYIADRVAVMHRGRLVEMASRDQLFSNPAHPYTRSLLQAVPHPDLAKPLDFEAITASGGSDPNQWPKAFQPDAGSDSQWLDLGQGHRVRARANANPGEIMQ